MLIAKLSTTSDSWLSSWGPCLSGVWAGLGQLGLRQAPDLGQDQASTLRARLKLRRVAPELFDATQQCVIRFGRRRSKQGAGPTTMGIDVGVIKLVLQHAAAVHGVPVLIEPVDLGRLALKRLGLVDHSYERDERDAPGGDLPCRLAGP